MLSGTRNVCVCLISPGGRAPGGSFSSMSFITSDDAPVCISRLDPTPDPKCISPTDHSVLPLEHLTGILSKTELPTCSPHCSSPQSSWRMTTFFSIFGPKSLESPLTPLSHFVFSLSSSPLESTFQMHLECDHFSSFPCPTLLGPPPSVTLTIAVASDGVFQILCFSEVTSCCSACPDSTPTLSSPLLFLRHSGHTPTQGPCTAVSCARKSPPSLICLAHPSSP